MIEEAKKVIPGGVQHNLAFNYPFPLVIEKAQRQIWLPSVLHVLTPESSGLSR